MAQSTLRSQKLSRLIIVCSMLFNAAVAPEITSKLFIYSTPSIIIALLIESTSRGKLNIALFGAQGFTQADLKLETNLSLTPILAATGITFCSFLGVEAMTHLANDFEKPKKDLLPAMMVRTVIIGVVYLTCTLLLVKVPVQSGLAMVTVFNQLVGGTGAEIIGILGIAGRLATVNVYTISVARLLWSFSKQGVLPDYFSTINQYHVPIRALSCLLLIMAMVLIIAFITKQNIEDLVAWCNGVFVVIYFATMLAAIKLLARQYLPLIFISCVFCLVIGIGLGNKLIYAGILIIVIAPLLWWQQHYKLHTHVAKLN